MNDPWAVVYPDGTYETQPDQGKARKRAQELNKPRDGYDHVFMPEDIAASLFVKREESQD